MVLVLQQEEDDCNLNAINRKYSKCLLLLRKYVHIYNSFVPITLEIFVELKIEVFFIKFLKLEFGG